MQVKSRNKFITAVAATLLTVVLLAFSLVPAFAESATLRLPVEQVAPDRASATYELEADDDAPMPEGAKDGVYTMTLTGAESEKLPTILFSQPGDYTYTLTATPHNGYACAPASLDITVRVGGDSSLQVVATNPSGDKVSALKFTLTAKSEPTTAKPTTTKTSTTTTKKTTVAPTTTKVTTTQKATRVNTGDEAHLWRYILLALVAAFALCTLARAQRAREMY